MHCSIKYTIIISCEWGKNIIILILIIRSSTLKINRNVAEISKKQNFKFLFGKDYKLSTNYLFKINLLIKKVIFEVKGCEKLNSFSTLIQELSILSFPYFTMSGINSWREIFLFTVFCKSIFISTSHKTVKVHKTVITKEHKVS